jgi:aspartyl-tRNA synthetase
VKVACNPGAHSQSSNNYTLLPCTPQVTVLNAVSKPLPFPISDSEASGMKEPIKEDTRLRNRVLDLR